MTSVDVKTPAGKAAGTMELPADIFDVQTNIPLLHQVVVAQLAAARQGTHDTKRRGEVSGSGKKPFKQKGTGRARQGSIRAPQYRGGGITHVRSTLVWCHCQLHATTCVVVLRGVYIFPTVLGWYAATRSAGAVPACGTTPTRCACMPLTLTQCVCYQQ